MLRLIFLLLTDIHMAAIKTSTWHVKLPPNHVRIGVSRGVPRGTPAEYRRMFNLQPGSWFNSVSPAEYLERYDDILAKLDPQEVADTLQKAADDIATGAVPVMVCYESAPKIHAGELYCHRHLIASWLESHLGIVVPEVGYEDRPFNRFAALIREGVTPPSYKIIHSVG
jgi:hypothetical protein